MSKIKLSTLSFSVYVKLSYRIVIRNSVELDLIDNKFV